MSSRIRSALVWTAAFAFALALYFLMSKWLRVLPPTEPVAVGRVTVDKASKLRDYVSAAIFYLFVPLATVGFAAAARMALGRFAPRGRELPAALLFAIPFWFAPFFYLTTRKEGWTALLPLILAIAGVAGLRAWAGQESLRQLFQRPLRLFHALLLTEAVSWIVFRYVVTGRRIAHFDTLFLEVVFVLFFAVAYWAAAILMSIVASRIRGRSAEEILPRFAVGASPLLALAPLALAPLNPSIVALVVFALTVIGVVLSVQRPGRVNPRTVRLLLAWGAIPAILFCINVASVASPWHWTDLFHRGESLGPASDYLRGKAPYREVFVLHGLLDDGLLDATMMRIFGRDQQVGVWRLIVLDSIGLSAVWLLAMAAFNSIPLAIASLAFAMVTSVGNQRVVLEILSAVFLVAAIRGGRKRLLLLSGIFAALALFYSLETGMYAIIGAAGTFVALLLVRWRRAGAVRIEPLPGALLFGSGVLAGSAPFLLYLSAHGAVPAFFRTSFVSVPAIIDAVWSVPFPKLGATFRNDPSLRSVSDFVLGEGIRFILNPVVLGVALIYLIVRFVNRTMTVRDQALIALTLCGIISQRSALGRADFPHQYFSAFLIGPILVMLLAALGSQLRRLAGSEEGRAFAGLFVLAASPILFVALWVPDLMNARINDMTAYRPRVAGREADPMFREVLERVESITAEVAKVVPPGRPVFDFSNQPALYFFTDRPNPTRFYQIPILSPPAYQRETIAALERAKPEVVFRRSPADFDVFDGISNEMRAPALAAYLDDHYRFSRTVRGVELWRRRPASGAKPIERYMDLHRIPTAEEVAAARRERFIFPAAASIEGIAGSRWRTDLTIYNPHEVAVPARLRFLSGDRLDREITVPPKSVVTHEDVVGSLFGARGSTGSLLLDVPALRPLAATARTWDAGRGGSAPAMQPMRMSDAAVAGSDRSALVMTGFPQGGRLNVGVMNVGRTPARFTVSAHYNEAWPASDRIIRGGAHEEDSYFVGQVESRLGVAVEPRLIIRIEVEQGQIIGYASVVDADSSDSVVIPAMPVKK